MQFIARWKIPAMYGDRTFAEEPRPTWRDAEIDAFDVRYEGVLSWVDPLLDPGEVPPPAPPILDETTAAHWRASKWWKNLPPHVVAIAQASQPATCMPVDAFQAAIVAVLGHVPPVTGEQLVASLRAAT